jgi:hypothetical protein
MHKPWALTSYPSVCKSHQYQAGPNRELSSKAVPSHHPAVLPSTVLGLGLEIQAVNAQGEAWEFVLKVPR